MNTRERWCQLDKRSSFEVEGNVTSISDGLMVELSQFEFALGTKLLIPNRRHLMLSLLL